MTKKNINKKFNELAKKIVNEEELDTLYKKALSEQKLEDQPIDKIVTPKTAQALLDWAKKPAATAIAGTYVPKDKEAVVLSALKNKSSYKDFSEKVGKENFFINAKYSLECLRILGTPAKNIKAYKQALVNCADHSGDVKAGKLIKVLGLPRP